MSRGRTWRRDEAPLWREKWEWRVRNIGEPDRRLLFLSPWEGSWWGEIQAGDLEWRAWVRLLQSFERPVTTDEERKLVGEWEFHQPYTWNQWPNRSGVSPELPGGECQYVYWTGSGRPGVRMLLWFPMSLPWALLEACRLLARETRGELVPEGDDDGHEDDRRQARSVSGEGSSAGEGSAEEPGQLREEDRVEEVGDSEGESE